MSCQNMSAEHGPITILCFFAFSFYALMVLLSLYATLRTLLIQLEDKQTVENLLELI